MPKMQNVHLKCWNDKSHCQVSVVRLKSLVVSPCNELLLLPMSIKNSLAWEYFFTHKSTFGVHYTTGSPGQLGLRVAGLPGHWVAGSQNVAQFHLWCHKQTDDGRVVYITCIPTTCCGEIFEVHNVEIARVILTREDFSSAGSDLLW